MCEILQDIQDMRVFGRSPFVSVNLYSLSVRLDRANIHERWR